MSKFIKFVTVIAAFVVSCAVCRVCVPKICHSGYEASCVLQDASSSKVYEVYSHAMSYQDARDLCSCKKNGSLCAVNSSNIAAIAGKLEKPVWVDSWNTDSYGFVCLQMINTSITASDCCEMKGAVCEYEK
jgi:hypothetical protein